jgi:hypothetical protein
MLEQYMSNPDIARRNPQLQPEPGPKPSKYGNKRTEYEGRVYASKREAERAQELDLIKRAGAVLHWSPQVSFELPGGVRYVADFVVIWKDWTVTVEDTKGFQTKEYRIKKKLFAERYGKQITEV